MTSSRALLSLLPFVVFASASASAAAAAGEAPPTRAEVEAALRKSPHDAAAEAEVVRLVARAEALLIAIVDDSAAEEAVRGRAVAALAHSRSARAHVFLENLIIRKAPSSAAVDRLLLRRAAVALGWQAGPRVVETVAPLLDHPDPEVRLDAAVALGLCRAHDAEKPLRARLADEQDPAVRHQIEAALRAVSHR